MNCIYKITNLTNGMIYVGQTKNIKRRIKEYKNKSKKLNKHSQYLIMQEINKYGFENFEFTILEDCIDDACLNDREIYWISKLDSRNPNIGYNSKEGGKGGTMTVSSIEKMRESSKNFKHSEEEKLRRSKPIIVYSNGKAIPFISAKKYADSINRSRSEVTAAIRRGIRINNCYIFYQDKNSREEILNKLIESKSNKNKVSKKSLYEYIIVYEKIFNKIDKESVETIE